MRMSMVLRSALAFVLVCAGVLFAQQRPVENVDSRRNPNLAEAQKLCSQAFDKLVAAQSANKDDMKGHDEKAKELLIQANNEIKEAAIIADHH